MRMEIHITNQYFHTHGNTYGGGMNRTDTISMCVEIVMFSMCMETDHGDHTGPMW